MDSMRYAAFAAPAFLLFLFLEWVVLRYQKKGHFFNYEHSVTNISVGIAERLLNLFVAVSFYDLYTWVYAKFRIATIPDTWWVWIVLLLATDLVWYWYHRLGHQINILWAAHIVHHQSEDFNFSVSARITTIQAVVRTVFWTVLPFAGFQPYMVMSILLVHGAYSFFTHTQAIGRLKWLEYVFITPSLHGVHHAADEKYLDKNFGDVFVFWDKLFGTFQREEEAPKYGLTHPLKSNSFLWQHFHYFLEITEAVRRSRGIRGKLGVIFGSPALLDQDIRPQLEARWLVGGPDESRRYKFRGYINLQVGISLAILVSLTWFFAEVGWQTAGAAVVFVLLTLINIGALLEQRQWIYYLECFRLFVLSAYLLWLGGLPELMLLPVVLLICLERIFQLRRQYVRFVLRYERPNASARN